MTNFETVKSAGSQEPHPKITPEDFEGITTIINSIAAEIKTIKKEDEPMIVMKIARAAINIMKDFGLNHNLGVKMIITRLLSENIISKEFVDNHYTDDYSLITDNRTPKEIAEYEKRLKEAKEISALRGDYEMDENGDDILDTDDLQKRREAM